MTNLLKRLYYIIISVLSTPLINLTIMFILFVIAESHDCKWLETGIFFLTGFAQYLLGYKVGIEHTLEEIVDINKKY